MNNLFITIGIYFLITMNDYYVLSVTELKAKLKEESRDLLDFDIQLRYSNALVYYLRSGKVVLMPSGSYNKSSGVLFSNKDVYDKYFSLDSFPVQNEIVSFAEGFQKEILNIRTNHDELTKYLSAIYKIDFDSKSLPQILMIAKERVGKNRISDKESMYTSLLLGEFIRKEINGKWILLKEYGTFNPYYVPAIINSKEFVIVLSYVSDFYFTPTEFSLNNFVKLPFIQEPLVNLKSDFFIRTYAGYKFP